MPDWAILLGLYSNSSNRRITPSGLVGYPRTSTRAPRIIRDSYPAGLVEHPPPCRQGGARIARRSRQTPYARPETSSADTAEPQSVRSDHRHRVRFSNLDTRRAYQVRAEEDMHSFSDDMEMVSGTQVQPRPLRAVNTSEHDATLERLTALGSFSYSDENEQQPLEHQAIGRVSETRMTLDLGTPRSADNREEAGSPDASRRALEE